MKPTEAASFLTPKRLREVLAAHRCRLVSRDGNVYTYQCWMDDVVTFFHVEARSNGYLVRYSFEDCDCEE